MSAVTAMYWQVRATRSVEYELRTVDGIFDPGNDALLSVGRRHGGRRFVVVDEQVHRYHGARIAAYFRHHGIDARLFVLPGGESAKTVDAWLDVAGALDDFPIHRRDEPIIAIGGGVLTDIVGFVASSYRRGVPHIKVPTTLMGYVDASVGIKTGVNFNGRKNRLGSFEPPRLVLLDRRLLSTLDVRHLRNGLCEILKLAVIRDAELFAWLEDIGVSCLATAFQDESAGDLLDRAIGGMLEELSPNLYEDELARCVDFGHTFSYGLETCFEDRLLHGESVLLDILVSTVIARDRALLDTPSMARIFALVRHLGIEPEIGLLDAGLMWQSLLDRIEHRNGRQRVPLPSVIGQCVFVDDISRADIEAAIHTLHTTWTER